MVSFGEGLKDGLRRGYCAYFGALTNASDWFARLNGVPSLGPVADLSKALYTYQCGTDEPPPLPPPPPFTGGQCPGVAYNVYAVRIRSNGNGPPDDPECEYFNDGELLVASGLTGPISGVSTRVEAVTPTVSVNVWEISYGTSQTFNLGGFFTGCGGAGFSAFRVQRADGLPDNCGDPTPPVPPVVPVEINIDIDYDGGSVTNVPVTIGPFFVNVAGNIYAPIEINLPDVNLTGNLELTPEFNFNPEFNLNIGGAPTTPDSDPPPENPDGPGTGEPEEPEEEPEDDRRIIGVICAGRVESDAKPSTIFQQTGPSIYAPRLGTVRFGTVISGAVFWSGDIPIKGLRSVIDCPIAWGASTVVVNADPGVALNWRPIRSLPPEYPPTLELGPQVLSDNR